MPLLIARRPIFDIRERLFAYDLAIRGNGDASTADHEVYPEQLVAEVFLEAGLASIVGNHAAFVTATREMLLRETVRVLPADRVIIRLPRLAADDVDLLNACRDLTAAGYRLAADVTDDAEIAAPMCPTYVIRVDVSSVAPAALARLADRLREYPARLLALNVPHRGERDRCAALGFDLFAGHEFTAPRVLSRRDIGVEHLRMFRILKLLRDQRTDDSEIESLIQGDVGLTYKLLRMVNSAAVGGREIWSIGHAFRLLGRDQVARWLSVLLVSDTGTSGVRTELIHLSLVRARMSERVAELAGIPRAAGSLFLVGVLSLLDQLLEVPMVVICDAIDLAPDLRNALLNRSDFFGAILQLVESYASGAWGEVEVGAAKLGVATGDLQSVYLDALSWATSQQRAEML